MIQTYILSSRGLYKIGKSRDFERRLKTLITANPDIEVCYLINADVEKELHHKFQHCRYKNEWFRLDEEDLLHIEQDYYNFFNKKEPEISLTIQNDDEFSEAHKIIKILENIEDNSNYRKLLIKILSNETGKYANQIF